MSDEQPIPANEPVPVPPPEPTPEPPVIDTAEADGAVEREMARKTRRSFVTGGIAALAGVGAWAWLRSRPADDGIPWPLRSGLRVDERLASAYFRDTRLARTFPASAVQEGRVNGEVGLEDEVEDWALTLDTGAGVPLSLTMDHIKALPKVEMITELKCIEGWVVIQKWAGARLRDFAEKYAPGQAERNGYVSLETPDRKYYVGLDMASAMHPQTFLAYERNGEPLEDEHGAPLRLAIPVKYGVKNLKRIGKIAFTSSRPRDYWAERGYDWYAGF